MLIYTAAADRYEGERLSVTVSAMEQRIQGCLRAGTREGKARGILLDEAAWRPGMPGVVELPRLCLHCRRPSGERRFCDVVCEAAFYAEVR